MLNPTTQKTYGVVIRVSRDVYNAIADEGETIFDTFDSILRRKFRLPKYQKKNIAKRKETDHGPETTRDNSH